MIPVIFIPCTLILSTMTAAGWCHIDERQLEFKRDILAALSFTHAGNSCNYLQKKTITTVQGNIQVETNLQVRCEK